MRTTETRKTETRKTGIDVVGDMPWGTHFCLFYETKADLLETLARYCKAGLESQEFCHWVVAEPLAVEDARRALERAVPDFDRYFAVAGAVTDIAESKLVATLPDGVSR